jgi:acyl-CoA thioesterase-2
MSDDRVQMAKELVRALEPRPLGDGRFEIDSADWWGGDRVFGGMVIAQAAAAASQTVSGVPLHSLHGYFLRPEVPGPPVVATVDAVRDGRTFTTRSVTLEQDGRTVFTATASFHTPEPGDEYQIPMPTGLPPPGGLPEPEWSDGPFEQREAGADGPGPDGTYRSTRRAWIRCAAGVPDDPAVHATLATFLSDMTGTSFRPLSLGEWGLHTDASLDHAVWLHRPIRVDEWLLFDLQAVVNTAGRATVRGTLFTQAGELCLSMAQELLIRPL